MYCLRKLPLLSLYKKCTHEGMLTRTLSQISTEYPKAGFLHKVLKKFGKLDYSRNKLQRGSFLLYEKCGDGVNIQDFLKESSLPDTYFSWFRVTELHVWMCMVRVMHEGIEGRYVRNTIVKLFWQDVDSRAKALGMSTSQRKTDLDHLYQQFLGALFLYDEGFQSNDKILAGAIWRRLLNSSCNNPLILENLLHYVRKQILELEAVSREDMLINGNIKWLSLKDLKETQARF